MPITNNWQKAGSFVVYLSKAEHPQLGDGSGSFIRIPLNINGQYILRVRYCVFVGNNAYSPSTVGVPFFYLISPQLINHATGENFIVYNSPNTTVLGSSATQFVDDIYMGPVTIPNYIDINIGFGAPSNPYVISSQNMCASNSVWLGATGIGLDLKGTILFDYYQPSYLKK